MTFHTILTHEYPDLDAMLCCYLLRRYGEAMYPGIKDAKLVFCPAGRLPEGKTCEELEREGILPVDIGGGRLDTHPQGSELDEERKSLSAANLVAIDLQIHERPSLKYLLEFTRLQDSSGQSLKSRNPIDHVMALPNLIKGGLLYFGNQFDRMTFFFMDVFQAIESAPCQSENTIPVECEGSLISIRGNVAFAPRDISLQSLFAMYVVQKFLGMDFKYEEAPEESTKWSDFNHFVTMSGILDYPELKKLIIFFRKLRSPSRLLNSDHPPDMAVSLPNIVDGFWNLCRQDIQKIISPVFLLFECIVSYEKNWQDSIAEYETNRRLHMIGNIKLISIKAKRGAVVKVARWQDKADLIIFYDEIKDNVSISINLIGRLKNMDFKRLAARIRSAEIGKGEVEKEDPEHLFEIGEIAGWFLHQSEKLLVHGSPKARRDPSRIDFETIVDLVITELDRTRKLPDEFCPPNECLQLNCLFYSLRLPNCFMHRQNLRPKEE